MEALNYPSFIGKQNLSCVVNYSFYKVKEKKKENIYKMEGQQNNQPEEKTQENHPNGGGEEKSVELSAEEKKKVSNEKGRIHISEKDMKLAQANLGKGNVKGDMLMRVIKYFFWLKKNPFSDLERFFNKTTRRLSMRRSAPPKLQSISSLALEENTPSMLPLQKSLLVRAVSF